MASVARGAGIVLSAMTCVAAASQAVVHAEVSFSGYASVDLRVFPTEPKFPWQDRHGVRPSIAFQPEIRGKIDEDDKFTIVAFGRAEDGNSGRTHFDLREANWLHNGGDWDLRVGVGKVFWGVAESRHLVDIINQSDLVEGLDEEDKLGQPMVNLKVITDMGTWSGFILPYFRERTLPDSGGRPALPLPVARDLAVFESDEKERHVDFALRWQERFGAFDLGLSHFHGTGREPRLVTTALSGGPALVPHYDLIDQTGLDAQATFDAWLLKFEAIVRSGQGDTFFADVAGVEYTLYQICQSTADLGLIAEHHYDGRDQTAPFTIFDNDLMVGARLALNDVDDTTLLTGAVIDIESRTTFMTVEFATRLDDHWKMETYARLNPHVANGDFESNFERENALEVRLLRYF